MKRGLSALVSLGLAAALGLSAAAAPLAEVVSQETQQVNGITWSQMTAKVEKEDAVLYTVEADAAAFEFAVATHGSKADTIGNMAAADGAEAVAVLNGDHFSFQTGIPMGMSASQGRLLTSPIEAYDADGYFFHALGIMADGTVKVGENPTLNITCRVGDTELTVDRINRTRETWEGGQVCLFTPDYGATTGTNIAGIEYILDTGDAVLDPGQTITATVREINRDNDAPIEEGTMVLSASLLCFEKIQHIEEGDEVEITLSFEDEVWNDVLFAVGGNRAIVEDGKPLPFEYAPGNFRTPNPRSALGVRADGTLVLVAVDGRSDDSRGLTANETAEYMANDLNCAYAILLDGGGSTALAIADEEGVLHTVNVPSDGSERPVGNAVMLLPKAATATSLDWIWFVVLGAAAVAAIALLVYAICKKPHGKNA